jgi:hypothetical protein
MSKTETSHFWVGRLPESLASTYLEEVYDEDDEDLDHTPLSAFARDQGEKWYDHDFLEYGFSDTAGKARVAGHEPESAEIARIDPGLNWRYTIFDESKK